MGGGWVGIRSCQGNILISILYMGEEGFDEKLEVGVGLSRDTFSRGTIGDDGMARVTRFLYFRKKIQRGGAGLGV